jgi:ATP-dependent Clp protease ATP-binding subunit ClpC
LIDQAEKICLRRGGEYVGVEHLFEALVCDGAQLPAALQAQAGFFHSAAERVYRDGWGGRMPETSGEIFYTPRCAAIIHESARLAKRLRSRDTQASHVLLALLADAHAAPCRALDAIGCDRGALIETLHECLAAPKNESVLPSATPPRRSAAAAVSAEEPKEREGAEAGPAVDIRSFTRDLTALAREGRIEAATGRGKELMQLVEILVRKGKHNAILVGEAGTGKTKIVEGLACRMVSGALREVLPQTRILELNIAAMISGTEYRGKFEAKVFALLEELHRSHDTILFIDEIHLMMGSGATEGGGMDLANLLKPALGRGELRCVGATTLKEYRQCIAKDPAMERRFQTVRVEPLSPEATLEVIEALRPSLEAHHGVRITQGALESAVQLTERYLPNRQLPDKAIDVLDQACARERINAAVHRRDVLAAADEAITVTPHTIRKVVSLVSAVPIEDITRDERQRLTDLEARLAHKVVGQDDAVAKVAAAVKRARTGLADPMRPDAVMLFLGPTGVGKTELAKQLAKQVFGSPSHLIRFDMSEFSEPHSVAKLIGAPPGYVGYGEEGRLTGAIKDAPFSVLLFDEIEKAHPRVFDLFLPILDEGRLKDADGRLVDFRHCMIIFTSNVGADVISRAGAGEREVIGALQRHFRPEFINRIDEIIPFHPLLFEDVRAILKGMIDSVRLRLKDQEIRVRMYQHAYEFLAQEGYSAEFGARELRRAVERHVVNPLSERLLAGEFAQGDIIEVLIENGALVYRKGERRESVLEALA